MMALFRPSRDRRDPPDRFLPAKMLLFALGAALALVGMTRESSTLILVAIVVLGAGLALRFFPKRNEP